MAKMTGKFDKYSTYFSSSNFHYFLYSCIPSKKVLIIGGACLAALILIIGLAVGLTTDDGGSSSNDSTNSSVLTQGPVSSCPELAKSSYWDYVEPTRYNLSFKLQPGLFVPSSSPPPYFNATAVLRLSIKQATPCILLQAANNLRFSSISITARSDLPVTILCSATEESPMDCNSFVNTIPSNMRPPSSSLDTDLIAIKLPEVLPANSTAYLTFNYAVGTASTSTTGAASVVSGLIPSGPFVNSTGQPAILMATRLEPTGARRLFPCYDAPKYRAIYTVDVTAPKEMTVLGNTAPMARSPTDSEEEGEEGMAVTKFKPTAPMPSYVLGIVVGDLKQVSGMDNNKSTTTDQSQSSLLPGRGVPRVEGWVAGDTMGRNLNYAVTAAQEAMAFFSSTDGFGINQPTEFTKLDIVAIPGWEGSQEAWGLVMLDEPTAFYDQDEDGEYSRYQTTAVVCQQAAAQWIGGMVAIDDWTQYGLKEGLTTIAQYRCLPKAAEKADMFGVTLPPHELRLQAHTPSGQAVSPRDGIVETAIDYASDPLASPIIPVSDLGMFDDVAFNDYIYISKSAAVFQMLDAFTEIKESWIGMFDTILKRFVEEFNGKAARYKDFMAVMATTVDNNSVEGDFYAKQLNGRVLYWILSTTPEEERVEALQPRDIAQNDVRSATVGGWFFRPVFPFIAPRREMINSTSALMTTLNMGATQQPFCSWLPDPQAADGVENDDEDGFGVLLERAQTEACFVDPLPWNDPMKNRYYSLLLSQDNLTDCNIGIGPANINLKTEIPGQQEDFRGNTTETGWILNHDGNRMYRTDFEEEHLTTLLSIIRDMAGGIEETEYQGPATMGQHSADGPDANDTDCKPTVADVFESNQVVNDVLAFTLQGYGMYTDGKWIVEALDAVAQSNVTVTPEGQFGMLGSAADSIDDLALLAEVGNCSAALHDLAMDMLQPRTAAIFYALPNKASDKQSVMTHLAGPTILWHSVLHKDANTTRLLCDLIPSTPLAQYLSNISNVGNQTANSTSNSNSTISTELRAAAYIALAAEPEACVGTDGDAVTAALIECWETSPEHKEAERCLFALPYVAGTEASVDYITSSDDSSVGELIEAYDGNAAMALRKMERTRLLSSRRPTLLKNTAERSLTGWSSAFSSLQEGWQDIVAAEGEAAACLALQGLPAPVTGEQRSGVEQWLRMSPGGVGCASLIKARVLGKAENTRRLVDDNDLPASLCAALEARG